MELMAGTSGNGSNQVTDIIGQFLPWHYLGKPKCHRDQRNVRLD